MTEDERPLRDQIRAFRIEVRESFRCVLEEIRALGIRMTDVENETAATRPNGGEPK